jgi:two-component system sensor histidine kinase PrrB
MRRLSLRTRLAFGAAAAVAVVVIVAGAAVVATGTRDQYRFLDRELASRANVLATSVGRAAVGSPTPALDQAVALAGDQVVLGVDADGVAYDSRGDEATPWPEVERGYESVRVDGQDWRVFRAPIAELGATTARTEEMEAFDVEIALPLDATESTIQALRRRTFFIGLFAVAVAAGLGWLVGSLVLRPLSRLRSSAEQIASTDDLSVRAPVERAAPEIRDVGESMNAMLARLEAAVAQERIALTSARNFAANVAHEVRTPLTSLRTSLDVLGHPNLGDDERQEVLGEARHAETRTREVLGALETLARGQLADDAMRERIDLVALVDAAVEDARRRWPEASITLGGADEGIEARGWPEGLRVLVDNLVGNAVVHGRRDGSPPAVQVTLGRVDDDVVLIVDDAGPGIAPEERASVLNPFVRGAAASGPGSGLGLALVDQQVRLHGGSTTIEPSPAGGARVVVRLPADQ